MQAILNKDTKVLREIERRIHVALNSNKKKIKYIAQAYAIDFPKYGDNGDFALIIINKYKAIIIEVLTEQEKGKIQEIDISKLK